MKHKRLTVLFQVLSTIEGNLRTMDFPWALTGSMNHFFQGIDIIPKDIDLITTREGVFEAAERLKKFELKKSKYYALPSIRSYYGVFKVLGTQVEVMGDVENLHSEGFWYAHEKWEDNIVYIPIEETFVPCLSLNYELTIYSKLGFSQRAFLIREKIKNTASTL